MRIRPLWSLTLACTLALTGCAAKHPAPVVDLSSWRDPRPDTYTVRRGDTLYSIALEHGADWRDVASWNGISDPTRLPVGQVLQVKPPHAQGQAQAPGAYTASDGAVQVTPIAAGPAIEVRSLDSASAATDTAPAVTAATSTVKTEPKGRKLPYSEQNLAAVRNEAAAPAAPAAAPVAAAPTGTAPAAPVETPPAAAPAPAPAPVASAPAKPAPAPTAPATAAAGVTAAMAVKKAAGLDWSWPASGQLMGRYSDGGSKGVRISGAVGSPVHASANGKVTYVGDGVRGYGNLVIVKHNDQYLSVYAHNSKIVVRDGQSVTRGEKIAEMGNGDTNQPLLHFEIRRFGKPVDPLQFLPAQSS